MDRSRLSAGQRLLLVGVWNTLIMALGAPRSPGHADERMWYLIAECPVGAESGLARHTGRATRVFVASPLYDSQLVLVDYQSRLMPSIHESDLVLRNALRLARIAKLLEVPVWGTEENPDGLGENPPESQQITATVIRRCGY